LPEDAGKPDAEMQRALETGRSEDESWRVRKDGSRVWVNEIMSPLSDATGRFVGFAKISRDLTERKALEDALQQAHDSLEQRVRERTSQVQSLFQRLVSAQEEERRRIARDIHDQVGQQMSALRINLEALRSQAEGGTAITLVQQAERTQRLAEELDRSIDFLTWQLRPAALDDLGLSAALQDLVTGWAERFATAVDFAVDDVEDVRLSRDVEANLYRIVQEALHNVAKHANATQVTVYLTQQNGYLMLLVEDNGCGFDAQMPPTDGHMGLVNMRERAALVGGRIEIESGAEHGTSIHVRIPEVRCG
jgi:signal transduction histidine kinase